MKLRPARQNWPHGMVEVAVRVELENARTKASRGRTDFRTDRRPASGGRV
jgi:hypothetical protein